MPWKYNGVTLKVGREFTVGTDAISYSWFRTAAVTNPPKLTASEKVTKSPTDAPCPLSVAVIVDEPSVAENVTPFVVVFLIGVIS